MEPSERLRVSVVYALPERQVVVELSVPVGTTAQKAIELSGLQRRVPEMASHPLRCGIYGRVAEPSQVLKDGDRVEILRPLLIDPKENRRRTAARTRAASRPRR